MMMGSSFPPDMSLLRIFEDLLCLLLDPVSVALAPHVEPSQELRASRAEHAIVIELLLRR